MFGTTTASARVMSDDVDAAEPISCAKSQSNLLVMFVQLIPLLLLQPLIMLSKFLAFVMFLRSLVSAFPQQKTVPQRYAHLLVAAVAVRLFTHTVVWRGVSTHTYSMISLIAENMTLICTHTKQTTTQKRGTGG